MSRKAKIIHRIIAAAGWLCLVWQFAFYLAHWSSLPEEPGIHFGRAQHSAVFDVYASKIYGFYPHLITLVTLAVNLIVTRIIGREKLKLGLKVREKGKRLITESIVITLDITALSTAGFFCCWTAAVSVQDADVMRYSDLPMYWGITLVFAAVIFQLIAHAVYKERPAEDESLSPEEKRKRRLRFLLTGSSSEPDSGMRHRLSLAVSWIIISGLTAIGLFVLERLPSGDIADEHHGQAWFANVEAYCDKWLVFLPFIIAVPIMLLSEPFSVRAGRRGNKALVKLFDRIRLILALCAGWCEIMLFSEKAIHPAVFCISGALLAGAVISYIINIRNGGGK